MIALISIMAAACAPQTPKITPTFLWALAKVERSAGSQNGSDGELGPFQIRMIYLKDVNRILREDRFSPVDRKSWQKSAQMTRVYLTFWGAYWEKKGFKLSLEDYCAMHRWGGPAWKPSRKLTKIDRQRSGKLRYYMDRAKLR